MCLVIHGCFSKADAIPLSDFTLKLLLQRGPIRVLRASSVISPNMDLIIAVGKQKPVFLLQDPEMSRLLPSERLWNVFMSSNVKDDTEGLVQQSAV